MVEKERKKKADMNLASSSLLLHIRISSILLFISLLLKYNANVACHTESSV